MGRKKLTFEFVKNFIENEGVELLSKEYINANEKLNVKCAKGHIYPVTFASFQYGSRCQICFGNQKLTFEFVKGFIENKGSKLLSKEYIGSHYKLNVECPKGHKYPVRFNDFRKGNKCPTCNDYRNENECREIFEKLTGYKFIKMRHNWIRNPKTNYPLELDGYCEELKIAFEHDGDQHHKYNKFFHRNGNSLEEIQFRDRVKDKLCPENGVKLLRIKYDVENKEKLIRDFLKENNIEVKAVSV